MADEPVLNDAWEVLKGNIRCALCDGTGLGEILVKNGDVYEVVEGGCQACDGTGWTTVEQFRFRYWREYTHLAMVWSLPEATKERDAVDRQLHRWQDAMRSLRGRD